MFIGIHIFVHPVRAKNNGVFRILANHAFLEPLKFSRRLSELLNHLFYLVLHAICAVLLCVEVDDAIFLSVSYFLVLTQSHLTLPCISPSHISITVTIYLFCNVQCCDETNFRRVTPCVCDLLCKNEKQTRAHWPSLKGALLSWTRTSRGIGQYQATHYCRHLK